MHYSEDDYDELLGEFDELKREYDIIKKDYSILEKEHKIILDKYSTFSGITYVIAIIIFLFFLLSDKKVSLNECNEVIKDANNIIFSLRDEIEDAKASLGDDYDTLYSKIDGLTLPDGVNEFSQPTPPDDYEEECVGRYC